MARRITRLAIWSGALATALALSACGSGAGTPASQTTPSSQSTVSIPKTAFSQELHDSLPQKIKDAKELRLVSIVLPPYSYFKEDGKTLQGLNVDMVEQLKTILGVDVHFETAPTIADITTGFASDRFDASIAPMSDLPATEASFDFADWLAEFVVFLVQKGNPKGIDSLTTACGTTIATLQGGTAEKVLKQAAVDCEAAGKKTITINTFADQNTAVLAVQSGRADAAFSSQVPLTYYVETDDNLELAGENKLNGFPEFWVGAYVPKGSPLAQTMLDAFKAMKESGAYKALLESYGIEKNAIDEFGINLATTKK